MHSRYQFISARGFLLLLVGVVLCTAAPAKAQLTIDVTRGNVAPIPVAITTFGTTSTGSEFSKEIQSVIQGNLVNSGLFKAIDSSAFIENLEGADAIPNFSNWKQIGAQALVTGTVTHDSRKISASFRLWDIANKRQIAGKSFTASIEAARRVGHLISDAIYTALTGEEGYFDSRIVYVSEQGNKKRPTKRLAIMDQDGANVVYLTRGDTLVLTPRFHPETQSVIYMDYLKRRPRVYLYDIERGRKLLVGNFDGMSFAPRFSPNGREAIMSASMDGNSEIYTVNLRSKRQTRLTNNPAIDTSPSFSPDGSKIVFNSDRGGRPALYVMNANGGGVEKISKGDGSYTAPVWSPRGDFIAFVKQKSGQFHIGVMRPDGTGERLLTESYLDESPTWSPNGRVILFARSAPSSAGSTTALYAIDVTGYNLRRVRTKTEASDPAWGPILSGQN